MMRRRMMRKMKRKKMMKKRNRRVNIYKLTQLYSIVEIEINGKKDNIRAGYYSK